MDVHDISVAFIIDQVSVWIDMNCVLAGVREIDNVIKKTNLFRVNSGRPFEIVFFTNIYIMYYFFIKRLMLGFLPIKKKPFITFNPNLHKWILKVFCINLVTTWMA